MIPGRFRCLGLPDAVLIRSYALALNNSSTTGPSIAEEAAIVTCALRRCRCAGIAAKSSARLALDPIYGTVVDAQPWPLRQSGATAREARSWRMIPKSGLTFRIRLCAETKT